MGDLSIVSVHSHGDIHILTLMERATAIRTAISLCIRWRAANQFLWAPLITSNRLHSRTINRYFTPIVCPFYSVFILEKKTPPRPVGSLDARRLWAGMNKVEDSSSHNIFMELRLIYIALSPWYFIGSSSYPAKIKLSLLGLCESRRFE